MSDWDDFVQAHGEIIGFDLGEYFLPTRGRGVHVHTEFCKQRRIDPGIPVYGPKAVEVQR